MKKIILAILVLLLASNVLAIRASVLDTDPFPARAGEFVDVFISVENISDGSTGAITVEIVPRDSIRLAFGQEAKRDVGIIPRGRSATLKYRMEVIDDAIDGENRVDVKVTELGDIAQTFELTVEVENSLPSIEIGDIDSEPAKILPDTDDVKLAITLLNIGESTAQNVKATLTVPSPIAFSDSFSNSELLGNIAANGSGTAVFYVDIPEETRGGKYPATVMVQYTLDNATEKAFIQKELTFDLAVKPVPLFRIMEAKTTPEKLAPGTRDVQLQLTVQNVGEADGESVRIKIFQKSEQPFEFDKTFDFIAPELKPGETGQGTLVFRIDDDAPLQKYLLEVEIKSFVDDTVRLETRTIPIHVSEAKEEGPNPIMLVGGAVVVVIVIAYLYRRRKKQAAAKRG